MKQTINPFYTGMLIAGLLWLAAAPLPCTAQTNDIYKWIDENGEVQYTQMPPPHGISAIRIQSAQPAEQLQQPAAPAVDMMPVEEEMGDDLPDDAPESNTGKAGQDAQLASAMKENCENARKNLATLNRGQNRYVKPNGEVFRLTEDERLQRIEETNEQISLFCK